ncbi:MAG: DegT/DnrJ/EryC1/StrS aminotransferase family protein [Alphaproteobacteria bacterium]|nr:DegT/DnrJ/EryC1/StrS aminotransferase family protein [Alphaproteobacteria bacterium]MDP6518098.1 DegT/DnrJ/EryC1/StrS aminotransferase family protein [Alphaproteobacteria bacterium]
MTDRARPLSFADLGAQYRRLKPAIDARIQAVLDHGRFILGPEVAELEDALAVYAGCAHAVGVASGTDALQIALMGEGIGPGDAVFLPAFTFTATAEVVALLGATPVFVDVDPRSFTIDCGDLARRLAALKDLRARAVIAVDLFGLPADYAALRDLAGRHGLFLLADAAQSFGATLNGARVGTLAPVTALSFFPAKPLGCYGDGGALLTDDADRAARYRSIRAHGKGDGKYDIERVGLNSRLDTLQAAILLAKLAAFDDDLTAREAVARRYDAALAGLVITPHRTNRSRSAWAQYAILLDDRAAMVEFLKTRGVPTAVHYPRPLHRQPAYAHFANGPLPVSEMLCDRILSLPMHPDLDEAASQRICAAVKEAVVAAGS